MSQIWNTNGKTVNPVVSDYTAGQDYLMDQEVFLPYDLQASKAHVSMLVSIELLTEGEGQELNSALDEILSLWGAGEFQIKTEQEDCHTAIEAYLTDKLGDLGKKIHTARSRNDQSLVMLRLYEREQMDQLRKNIESLISTWSTWIKQFENIEMPGYTHLQRAMPTTLGLWLGSFQSAMTDLLMVQESIESLIDQNPLGSAAGFGVPMDIDREVTKKELEFSKVQKNPIYCQFSRGFFEGMIVNHIVQVHTVLSRWASDLLLFTTKEFNFFDVDSSFTTSSSIMPQKKNQDVFELMRGRLGVVQGAALELQSISGRLFSGYQRDLQLTKDPLVRSFEVIHAGLEIAALVTPAISPREGVLRSAMSEDLYATHKVYELVKSGVPFREAYAKVKESL